MGYKFCVQRNIPIGPIVLDDGNQDAYPMEELWTAGTALCRIANGI